MSKDYKERARERFEQFKKDYDYDELDEFKWEQKFLLEEEFKEIPIEHTRQRNDVMKLIEENENFIRHASHRKKIKNSFNSIDKILFAKIPMIKDTDSPDDFAISLDTAIAFGNKMREVLPRDYGFALTIFEDMLLLNGENVERLKGVKSLNYDTLKEIIKKGE